MVDVSLLAFILGTVNLALLGLLFLAWRRDRDSPSWRLKTALRLQEHDQRLNELSARMNGVEALLVSTVGQETMAFCRAMDEIMERMDKPEEKKQEPGPKPKEKLALSKEHVGRFAKKEAKHGNS